MAMSRKLIKSRISSVKNTRKITKAMEMVAASKMRKAVSATFRGRPYVVLAKSTIEAVMERTGSSLHHPMLEPGTGEKELVILFTSDRGLAGGYNVNMVKFAREQMKSLGDVDVVAVGKRGSDAMQRLQYAVVASFAGLGNAPRYADIVPVARLALDGFLQGKYRRVRLMYTDYISGVTQTPTMQTVLPYGEGSEGKAVKTVIPESEITGLTEAQPIHRLTSSTDYTIEPNASELLSRVIPNLVMTTFYQALLESSASEHAARMLAMKNASDSARDMMESLTFTYNQVRQAAITQEIAEISSGAAALA